MEVRDKITRRKFLESAFVGTAGTAVLPQLLTAKDVTKAAKRTATDLVALGRSKVRLCRLGMGTGTRGGKIQRELGREKFIKLIRYGIERGVTYIDTADNYNGMHEMIKPAIKGIDREKIQILCKIWPGRHQNPLKEIDRFRREIGTDYFDVMLMHCVRTPDWVEQNKRLRDLLDTAREKKIIRATGVSIHGLLPLRAAADTGWGDVRLVRINHNGHHMDNLKNKWKAPGNVSEVVRHIKKMHADGKGIIGMKLIGEGDFKGPELRRKSIDFVIGLGCVNAVTIGFKSPAEIDEAITNINNALAKHPAKSAST